MILICHRGLDNERSAIVTSGLRRVAVTCRESALSCAALAGTGAITKILDGFKDIFITRDPQYQGEREDNNNCLHRKSLQNN